MQKELAAIFRSQKREAVPLITEKDITGFAPVHYAAKYGHREVRDKKAEIRIINKKPVTFTAGCLYQRTPRLTGVVVC